jgi:biotin transport system substrate-specific component
MKIAQISRISLFAAILSISVYLFPPLIVPLINVPFTLQTLFVILIGFLLKPTEAFLSVFIYIMMGAIGLPVYSFGRSGFSVLLGPSGGFLMLFPFVSLFISLLKSKTKNKVYDLILGFSIGIVSLYLLAAIWLSLSTTLSYGKALLGLLPFIPGDIIKLLLAYAVYLKVPKDFIESRSMML